jgi:predicted patatin/cPLA2 family phospholipase
MDLIFNKIPNELYPYDYETFNNSKSNFTVVTTNCETGEAEYFRLNDMKKDIMYLQASCSIPMFTNMVEIDGLKLVDGGVSDSIPIEYAIKQGCNKNIVILTRDETYVKNKVKFLPFVKRKYKKYPKLVKSIENRHLKYNKTLNLIKSLEEKNEVLVIRPKSPVKVSQVEKNKDKLINLYNDGYNDAKNSYEKILEYINK